MTSSPKRTPTGVTRRELFQIGNVLALPVLLGGVRADAEAAARVRSNPDRRSTSRSALNPIINCRGTFTIIGGSVERPEVRAAMEAASRYYVQMDELADAVGQRLAELTGAEWGMVSAGCAAGLKHVTAACVAGGNPEKLHADSRSDRFREDRGRYPAVLADRVRPRDTQHRREDDHRGHAGGTREGAESADGDDLPDAGGPAMSGPLRLEAIARIAKPKNIPILVDAAAEVLTIPNVHLQRGATVVAYSGGKAICGPQCAGLLLGRKDLLMSAWQASSPHHGPGRDNKVGREETLGMLAAVEAWVKRDHAAEWKTWLSWLDNIAKRVSTIDSVTTAVREPTASPTAARR